MTQHPTLLVTGGAGFIGSTFVEQAVERGNNVIVLDALTYAGHKSNLRVVSDKSNFNLVVGNICDGDLVAELLTKFSVDAVVNFAAESHVDNSIHSPGAFIETNILGTYTMLQASLEYWRSLPNEKQHLFRYLQISTDEVYGSLGETGAFDEHTAMKPNSPYSSSKAAGDHLVRAWNRTYDLPTITTNCSNNYGPRQFPEKLIPCMITRALAGKSLPVYGDGKNIRDWIHVEDHCNGVYLALTQGQTGQTYCFGGNAERTNIDLVNLICSALDQLVPSTTGASYSGQIKFVADRLGHDRRYAIDDSKAVKELGFTRRYDLQQGLEATIKWYLDNQAWCQEVTQEVA